MRHFEAVAAEDSYDACVVGASIAGCTTAALLARSGARVALLERHADPDHFKRVCTHFIQSSAFPTIERLGWLPQLEAAGMRRSGAEMWTRWGWIQPPKPNGAGPASLNLRREVLDPLLRRLAAETPGVEPMLGWSVEALVRAEDGRVAGVEAVARDGERRAVAAQLTVAADGRDSTMAELAQLPTHIRPHERFAYAAYYRDLPLPTGDAAQVWFLDPEIAYAFPTDDGLTLVACMPTKRHLPDFRADLEGSFERWFEGLPEGPDLARAERVSKLIGKLDMPNVRRRPAAPGTRDRRRPGPGAPPLRSAPPAGAARARVPELRLRHGAALQPHGTAALLRRRPRPALRGALRGLRNAQPAGAKVPRPALARPGDRHQPAPPPLAPDRRGGMNIAERRIEVEGIASPLLEAGPGDAGEGVVFVHGNPGSGRDWERLLAAAGEHGRAVAPDMPGFGRADKPPDFDYSVDGYARHLGRMLDELDIGRAHLVLHDFGGGWGLRWATLEPERLASLVLVDTGVLRDYRWHVLARIWRTPLIGELFQAMATRGAFRRLLQRGQRRPLPRAFLDRMYDDYDRRTRRAVLRLYRATASEAFDALVEPLRAIDPPTLVVWGELDPYISHEQAQRQRETFPHAEVVVLPDCGHWPFVDDPEGAEKAIVPFLTRQLGGVDTAAPG